MGANSFKLFAKVTFLETSFAEFYRSSLEKGFPCQISLGNTNQYTEVVLPDSLSNNKLMLTLSLKKWDITSSVLPTFDHEVVLLFFFK